MNNCFSPEISVFHGRKAPEPGKLVGYAAIIEGFQLSVPMPAVISLISTKKRQYQQQGWQVFTPRHQPEETLYKQLVFALKYEGVNLLVFKRLTQNLSEVQQVELISKEPTGQYSRRIWFLLEWLSQKQLPVPDLNQGNSVLLLDESLHFTIEGERSARHRIVNNLPGTVQFCPLVRKTEKLEALMAKDFADKKGAYLKTIHKDVLQRASAFLLLKDSKASFTIEGESPKSKRAMRWGQAIGQAGMRALTNDELLRLQQLVIENDRFVSLGFRTDGGFVGEHDRTTGEPLPEHISARWQDLESLVNGLIQTNQKLEESEMDAVVSAAIIAFGFVFIHPFADGNGRIHRYIVHHMLARREFAQQGIIFPVSAAILDRIDDYKTVLERYSHPLLDFIEWKATKGNNVEVTNETADLYRYFDATKQAEFLYECVEETLTRIIPEEVDYLRKYDAFKTYIDDEFEMPDKLVANLVRYLEQNSGQLPKNKKEKEFSSLTDAEVQEIEKAFRSTFKDE